MKDIKEILVKLSRQFDAEIITEEPNGCAIETKEDVSWQLVEIKQALNKIYECANAKNKIKQASPKDII